MRGLAITVLFSVWQNATFLSSLRRYLRLRRRAWKSWKREAECVSP